MEKLFFIAIIPPAELSENITEIKQDFADRFESRRALRIMPHITLKAPFKLAETKRKGLLEWFENLNISNGSFDVVLNGFGAFANPKNPIIYIRPEESTSLLQLQQKLIDKISNLLPKEVLHSDEHFRPHMTVAYRDLLFRQFETAWQEYENKPFLGEFTVSSFSLLEHDGKKWHVIATKML